MVMLDKNIKRMNSGLSSKSLESSQGLDEIMPENIKLIDFGLAIHEY